MKPKVIIIGHGYTSRLGVARAIGSAGYPVAVVAMIGKGKRANKSKKPLDCYSKYVKEFHFCQSDRERLVEFLIDNFVEDTCKPILIPDNDFSASVVDANLDRLKKHFLVPNINMQQGEIEKWMNKELQKQRAKEIGLHTATGISLSILNGKYIIPGSIKYPCFCKPLATIVGGKLGLKKCNNKEELDTHLQFLARQNPNIDVHIEEFLTIDKEFALVGFSDGNNVIIPGVFQIKEMSCGGHFGVARFGKVYPYELYADIIEQFKALIKSIHLVGVFDIDFLLCQGKYYFDEINMRFGGSGTAITQLGVNLPAMLADYLSTGEYSTNTCQISQSATYVNERMCLDDWYFGNISSKHFKKLLNEADISFIKDDNDILPYRRFQKEIRYISIKRILRRFYKRIKNNGKQKI